MLRVIVNIGFTVKLSSKCVINSTLKIKLQLKRCYTTLWNVWHRFDTQWSTVRFCAILYILPSYLLCVRQCGYVTVWVSVTCRCDTSAAMKSLSASLKTRYRSIIETSQNIKTRHRASTSMYSLTFCVRFLSPERHQWKARSPDYRSNVENARRWRPVAGRRRAQTSPSRPFALCRHIAGWTQACN